MTCEVSVVIPVFNESANIERLVTSLNDYFSGQTFTAEVLFVDDGSSDDSRDRLAGQRPAAYAAKIIALEKNFGSHAALRAGIRHAEGERVTCLAADLQDPPALVGRLREKCLEGFRVAFASRNSSRGPSLDRFFSKVYAQMVRWFLFPFFPENGFDVVMFDRAVKDRLDADMRKNGSLFLEILSFKMPTGVITYDKDDRKAGQSKWTLSKKIKLFLGSFFSRGKWVPEKDVFVIRDIISLKASEKKEPYVA